MCPAIGAEVHSHCLWLIGVAADPIGEFGPAFGLVEDAAADLDGAVAKVADKDAAPGHVIPHSPYGVEGQQNTPAAHSSGRSRVQLINLANIAVYVVARIVLVPLSGPASGEFQLIPRLSLINKG